MNWFYAKDGQQAGPVDDAELDRLVQSGAIADSTLVWHSGLANWQPYSSVRTPAAGFGANAPGLPAYGSPVNLGKLQTASVGPGQTQCTQCGRVLPADEVVRIDNLDVCAECKPAFLQRMREGVPVNTRANYAGFGVRFGAAVLDGLILIPAYVVYGVLLAFLGGGFTQRANADASPGAAVVQLGLQLAFSVLVWCYSAYCVSKYGGTPGKRLCKLRVVTGNGQPVTFARGIGRYAAKFVSKLILSIGYLFIAFDDQKRALHDMICDTRVVYDQPPNGGQANPNY